MVAADVHGKNHHRAGSFGEHVRALRMRVADGRVLEVTEEGEPDLFRATLGGMGLTGHVLEVELDLERIPSPWILEESERVGSLDELLAGLRAASAGWPFSVAWVDSLARSDRLGRGIVIGGRWAEAHEAPAAPPRHGFSPAFPFDLPGFAWSRPAMRAFNSLWYRRHPRGRRRRVVAPRAFFHPLDAIRDWNRAYGARGMTQYQAVVPHEGADTALRRLFEILAGSGEGTFLCVVKDFGREGRGLLSFPRPGLTLSVDVPVRGGRTQALVDRLNEVVIEARGRVYLAKDAFTRPEHFRAMETRLPRFLDVRRKWDPEGRLASAQSVRLFGDRA
jgi:FAD/FMN-containing dehydrogenase